jgi:glycosyltransferase involved in cell wall biosynthesis
MTEPVALCITVRDESASIDALMQSISTQTRPPDRVVIVDGGSRDDTVSRIRGWMDRIAGLEVIEDPGANISRGRNLAIAQAGSGIVAVTDAGVRLEPRWLESLIAPFEKEPRTDVVSGFFKADARTAFELALGATTLPLVDEIDPSTFLPSSRSIAFRNSAWRSAGGYPEWLDYCEDLVFDFALLDAGFRFGWAPGALVHFRPRPTPRDFFKQYFRYARGDGKADLWRKRHAIRYATYALGPLAAIAVPRLPILGIGLLAAAACYLATPYRRLVHLATGRAFRDVAVAAAWVPWIRLIGDVAKMAGYPVGVWWRLSRVEAPPNPAQNE